uniref:Sulfide-quinone reductase n=1 Tax=Leptospirillum ferriphilum TaxID=178606 RepID=A0A7C3QXV0_9BACT
MKKEIIVLGAGTGGMPAAYELQSALGDRVHVTVINQSEYFQFVPSNPWVAVGWRTRKDTTFPIRPYLEKKGIDFVPQRVETILPRENRLILAGGESLSYDYLVITTGPRLAFDLIEGAGPGGFTQSVCTVDHAEGALEKLESFLKDPGPVIVGSFQGASCFGPAYEYAFILDRHLRNRKIRNKVPMTFVTSEPYIGHLGLGGVGDSRGMMESEFRNQDIKWILFFRDARVTEKEMFVEEVDSDGKKIRDHVLPFKYSMMIPPFRGIEAVAKVEGLVNPAGFVIIDDFQRSPSYPNIYSAGVCVAIPPVEKTPVPTGTPKTGYMIESMVSAIVENIRSEMEGHQPSARGTWNAICLADMGDTGAAFVALPQIPPRNVAWMKKGKWVHLAKVAFEKYFIRKMKTGASEPVYEKYMLKALGIEKIQK